MLVGISGKANSGKDTLARMLIGLYPEFKIHKFSDILKDMVCVLLDCDRKQLEDRKFKETILSDIGKSPREIMQLLGTEFGRKLIHEDLWVLTTLKDYYPRRVIRYPSLLSEICCPDWIITDVRFENEIKAIKDLDGLIVRIERPNLKNKNHVSETALDNYKSWDYVVNNDGSLEELEEEADKLFEYILERYNVENSF